MTHWLLRMFRLAVVIGVLAWAVETGDLSEQARGFVETAFGTWTQSIGR